MAGKRRADVPASGRPSKTSATSKTSKASTTSKTGKLGKDGKPKEPKTPKQRVLTALKWSGITFLVLTLIAVGGFIFLYRAIDIPDADADFEAQSTIVYYADGKTPLGKFAIQDRDAISYNEMPQNIKDAVVAAENRSFWTDNGVDVKGIIRAALNNASGGSTEGASTITQQLVKILYLNQEQSYTRKVKEAILALKIQRSLSKEEVLTDYLNTIYFGRGAYGIEAASQAYFGISAEKLNLRQAAVLASVLNDPNDLDPADGKEARADLRERYEYTLRSMADIDTITADEAEKAARKLPPFEKETVQDAYGGQNGFVLTMVRKELLRLGYSQDEIDRGGLRVTTTFTKKDMNAVAAGVQAAKPAGFGDKYLHIGAASVEPGTGAVRGFFGGQDFLQSQLNWAVLGGQAGSTFKPFALAEALEQGYSLKSTFDGNSPLLLDDGSEVENQGDEDYGSRISLLTATENSVNTAYVDMVDSLDDGPQSVIDKAVKMGIPPDDPTKKTPGIPNRSPALTTDQGLRIALGSQTVSPINMANAYATIANGGMAAEPYIIESVESDDGVERHRGDHGRSDDRGRGCRRLLRAAAGRPERLGYGGAQPRSAGGRQDRHRHQDRWSGVVLVVRGIHPPDVDRGDVRPWCRQRAARRLVADLERRQARLLRWQLSGEDLDRDHEARDGGAADRAVPGAGLARRGRPAVRRARAVHPAATAEDHQGNRDHADGAHGDDGAADRAHGADGADRADRADDAEPRAACLNPDDCPTDPSDPTDDAGPFGRKIEATRESVGGRRA